MGMVKKGKELPPVPEVPKANAVELVGAYVAGIHKGLEKAGDDKVLTSFVKQPVDARSASIERQALIKSVLESPTLAQRVIGLNQADAFKEFEVWFAKAVEVFYSK